MDKIAPGIASGVVVKLFDLTILSIGWQLGYILYYKKNYQKLQTKLEDISAAREEVQHQMDQIESAGGERIETTVLIWKRRADEIITRVEEFMKDGRHAHTVCFHGLFLHPVLRYQLSKKSKKLVKEIDELHGKKQFSSLSYKVPLLDTYLLSTGHYYEFDSRNDTVLKVMNELRNPDAEMILVWGIGGVGKTTLVEEVLRHAMNENLFDDVVMVRDVKENPDLVKIQKEIAKKLCLCIDEKDTLAERAPKLCDRIKCSRILIALDDVWEEINLMAIGLPRLVNCKVLLTSRSRKKLSLDMRTQVDIPLDVLNEDEAWELFEKMAGDVVKDSSIRSVAIEVAKNCGRLPILIVTVARAMKDRNKLSTWKDTRRRLGGFDKKELKEKAYLALEWSYNQLEDKELRPLFLLCGILVVQNHISLTDLLNYGFGLGLFKNVDTIDEARDALNALVEKLRDSCLLLDSDKNTHVRMHDLVCEVAVWIAPKEQQVLSVEYGGELKVWPDKEFFRMCSKVSLKSSNIPMLSLIPPGERQRLEMFYLYREDVASMEIPSIFFCQMEKLRVLGFTNVSLLQLPSSVEFLMSLRTLCLENCKLKDISRVGQITNLEVLSLVASSFELLPKEIGELLHLRWLDLTDCFTLRIISPNVLRRLEKLEELRMRNVFSIWEAERTDGICELKDCSNLRALEIHIPEPSILPLNLVTFNIRIGDILNWTYMPPPTRNTLRLELSDDVNQGVIGLLRRVEILFLKGQSVLIILSLILLKDSCN